MKQILVGREETEAPADLKDGERVELIRLGGPRDGDHMAYATVRFLPGGDLQLEVEEEDS